MRENVQIRHVAVGNTLELSQHLGGQLKAQSYLKSEANGLYPGTPLRYQLSVTSYPV